MKQKLNKLKVATVFSGVGSIEKAMENLKIEHEIIFACDNGERYFSKAIEQKIKKISNKKEKHAYIEEQYNKIGVNYVQKNYLKNYQLDEKKFYQDINFLDGKKYKNKIDLFVGGSPCQSFSVAGNKKGLEDSRGTLFYEYARLINEIKPKTFIFENVPGILSHDDGKTWEVIKKTFEELNYHIKIDILNAKNYGIPQNRRRLFVIGFKKKTDFDKFEFPRKIKLEKNVSNFLEKKVDEKYFLGEKGFKFVTSTGKHRTRAQVNSKIMNCQKANQQFNWNGEFVFVEGFKSKYMDTYESKIGSIRKLTPKECFKLMGFNNFKFDKTVPDTELYRQSGNSIVVDVFEKILTNIYGSGK